MTNHRTMGLGLVTVLLLGGAAACDNEPAQGKVKVEATAAVAKAALADEPAGQLEKWSFSEEGSSIEYTGAKVTGKHDGKFDKFKGTIQLARADITKSRIELEIDVASIQSDSAKLTGHLKGPDFLEVEKFPRATFRSTSVVVGGENGATHTVTGNLSLHGVEKSISFPVKLELGSDKLGASAEFAINRKDFAIVYPGKPDNLIKDDVLFRLNLVPKRA